MDNKLTIRRNGKPKVNLMLYQNQDDGSIEFYYPWLLPVSAKMIISDDLRKFDFCFTQNYLRFSNLVAEGWEIIDIFRSLLQIALLLQGKYAIHAGALDIDGNGVLIPSFGNTGKTTTSWSLAIRGAQYLTDELAILNEEGMCFSLPCSSLLSRSTISALGLRLSNKERFSLALNELKSKILTTRWAQGGIKVDPERHLRLCEKTRINTIAFIQNGVNSTRKITRDEAMTKLRAIHSYELNWRANPFVIAQAYFNPQFDLSRFSILEEDFLQQLFSKIENFYVISSSTNAHYQSVEGVVFAARRNTSRP